MFKSNVKITYAESWLPLHHRFLIHTVELLSARISLEKRYKNFISLCQDKQGTDLWKHALNSMGIQTPKLDPIPKRAKSRGLIIVANHPFGVADGVFLSWFASTLDENFKVIAHGVLRQEPILADNILPIDFSNRKDAMRNNVVTRQTAIKMLKYSFNLIDDGLVGQQLFAGEATRLAYGTDEAVEGRTAFLEKRDQDFTQFDWHF